MNSKPFIHPNTPRKLATAFHFARNHRGEGFKIRVLEKKLGVNFKYLYKMIRKGIEPNDTTEKLRAVRKAMFLPARKRRTNDTQSRVANTQIRCGADETHITAPPTDGGLVQADGESQSTTISG